MSQKNDVTIKLFDTSKKNTFDFLKFLAFVESELEDMDGIEVSVPRSMFDEFRNIAHDSIVNIVTMLIDIDMSLNSDMSNLQKENIEVKNEN